MLALTFSEKELKQVTMESIMFSKVKANLPWLEARVIVNQYLLFHIGSAFMAGNPALVDKDSCLLQVPVLYTTTKGNKEVGTFYVKADTNKLLLPKSTPKEEIYHNAEID